MRIVHGYHDVAADLRGAAVAVGNFDGVHRGHLAVIDSARAAAARLDAPLGVVTFEPHPRQIFRPDDLPFRLTSAAARAHRLEKLDVDILYLMDFTRAFASLSAEDFARDVIAGGLGLLHVSVGADFCFGKGREGGVAMLRALGRRYGFSVDAVELISGGGGEFSSTGIREAVRAGRPGDAARMLGHWHRIEGVVERGDQRGRDLGYPTANLSLDGVCRPAYGVYAVRVDVLDGPHRGFYEGVANAGLRPMFDKTVPNFEAHLFNFFGDLYGAEISVALVAWLRPEMKFDTIAELIAQMDADSAQARRILALRE